MPGPASECEAEEFPETGATFAANSPKGSGAKICQAGNLTRHSECGPENGQAVTQVARRQPNYPSVLAKMVNFSSCPSKSS